jgi:hypothetical protein
MYIINNASNAQEKFEDIKGVIWSRKSKKERQYNGLTKSDRDK